MLSAKLVVVGGEVKTTEIKLRLPAVIGRGKGSTITLLQPLVSRQHCELFESNGRLWVRDLGSLNGTYVNNEKISEGEVPPNELLTIGTVTFRAIYEPLDNNGAEAVPVPEYLPSKAKDEDDQPTIRVDDAGAEGEPADFGDFPLEDLDADEGDGLPSTPLFAAEPTKPAPQRQASPVPTPAARQVAIPAVVKAEAIAKSAPPEVEEEPADDDDDLNDFLKNLGGKK